MSKVDVVILAGADAEPEMNPTGEVISRGMVDVCGKPMIQWIVDALRGTQCVGRIAAVGDVEAEGLDIVVEPGVSLVDNIRKGIDALDARNYVLIVSSDIPMLTSQAVDDFICRALEMNVDLAYPIIPKEVCEKSYPGFKRTYVKTSDGIFTGGNIMLASPRFLSENWESIQNAYSARKQVFKLARMIGVGVLVKVLVAQMIYPAVLRLATLESAASRLLGSNLKAVVSLFPEIGEDVDKLSDLEEVRRILSSPKSM